MKESCRLLIRYLSRNDEKSKPTGKMSSEGKIQIHTSTNQYKQIILQLSTQFQAINSNCLRLKHYYGSV